MDGIFLTPVQNIEIHSNPDVTGITTQYFADLCKITGLDVRVFHVPIRLGNILTGVGMLNNDFRIIYRELVKKSIQLLDSVCKDDSKRSIVMHAGQYIKHDIYGDRQRLYSMRCREIKLVEEELLYLSEYAKEVNPNIVLAVENNAHAVFDDNSDMLVALNWYSEDLPRFIRDLGLSNVKCCLDTCHAFNSLFYDTISRNPFFSSIFDLFNIYAPVIDTIHLSGYKNIAATEDVHGVAFSNTDFNLEVINHLLNLIKSNAKDVNLTLEVREDDFLKRPNFCESYNTVKELALTRNDIEFIL